MIHSQRRFNPVVISTDLKTKFRGISTTILKQQAKDENLNPLYCVCCKKTFKNLNDLELDHAKTSFDDLLDGFISNFPSILEKANEIDFRKNEYNEIKENFKTWQLALTKPQYLCKKCHDIKTREDLKYAGGERLI